MSATRRSTAQRAVDNASFEKRIRADGIARFTILVPITRIPDLRALALKWRYEAKLLVESDLPAADQILRTHGVCRTQNIPLPLHAFETRNSAAEWLTKHEAKLGRRRLQTPHIGSESA